MNKKWLELYAIMRGGDEVFVEEVSPGLELNLKRKARSRAAEILRHGFSVLDGDDLTVYSGSSVERVSIREPKAANLEDTQKIVGVAEAR
jgi:hypothetical protein